MSVVGIDLGTTNTVIACVRGGRVHVLADEEGRRLLPSVVSFHPNGDVLVGQVAKERRTVDARNTIASVKRLIGRSWRSDEIAKSRSRFAFEMKEGPGHAPLVVARGNEYTLPEISAFVLKRVKQIAEQAMGEAVERAVITVPASFNELQRASTKVAGRVAGLEVLRILNEPTAAALAYGLGRGGHERIAVYDFGGGTFDCTLLDLNGNVFEVLATAGDSFLGGDDLDVAIAERMSEAFLMQHRFDPREDPQIFERMRAAAELVKIELSSQPRSQIHLREVAFGAGGSHLDIQFGLTQGELDVLAEPFIERTFKVCQDALALAGLSTSAFDKVILVGGSTRIASVRRRVEQFFDIPILDRVSADEVVGIGAAIQAAALTDVARRRSIPPPPQAVGRTTLRGLKDPEGKPLPDLPPMRARTTTDPGITGTPLGRVNLRTTSRTMEAPPAPPTPTPVSQDPPTRPRPRYETERMPSRPPLPSDTARLAQAPLAPRLPNLGSAADDDEPTKVRPPLTSQPERDPADILAAAMPIVNVPAPASSALADLANETLEKTRPGHDDPTLSLPKMTAQMAAAIAMPEMPSAIAPQPQQETRSPLAKSVAIAQVPDLALPPPPAQRPPAATQDPVFDLGPSALQSAPFFPADPPAPAPPPAFAPAFAPAPAPVIRTPPPPLPTSGGYSLPPGAIAPLLIDVTPRALVVETVGGYCDTIIPRNVKTPCERTRAFSTVSDQQTTVQIRVAQGEAEVFSQNVYLGELELTGLRPARRGEVSVAVTFGVDANGTLQVRATDVSTGREAHATLQLLGVAQETSIAQMTQRVAAQRVGSNVN